MVEQGTFTGSSSGLFHRSASPVGAAAESSQVHRQQRLSSAEWRIGAVWQRIFGGNCVKTVASPNFLDKVGGERGAKGLSVQIALFFALRASGTTGIATGVRTAWVRSIVSAIC